MKNVCVISSSCSCHHLTLYCRTLRHNLRAHSSSEMFCHIIRWYFIHWMISSASDLSTDQIMTCWVIFLCQYSLLLLLWAARSNNITQYWILYNFMHICSEQFMKLLFWSSQWAHSSDIFIIFINLIFIDYEWLYSKLLV